MVTDMHHATHSLAVAATSALSGLVVSFFASFGVTEAYREATALPPPKAIVLVGLHWEQNKIGQELRIDNPPVIGRWAASFTRPGGTPYVLCSGGNVHPYDGRSAGTIFWMSPSEWTQDDCPAIQTGDIANVVWEWTSENGTTVSTKGSLVIP